MCVVQRSQKQKRERERERTRRREKNARDTISFFMFFFLTPLLFARTQSAFRRNSQSFFVGMSTLFFFFFCVSFFKNFSQNLSDADALAKNDKTV